MAEEENGGSTEALPPPPPVPLDFAPAKAEPEPVKKKVLRVPMARRGLGSKGQKIPILTNHFKVNVSNVDGHFFHYSVCFHTPLLDMLLSFLFSIQSCNSMPLLTLSDTGCPIL